MNIAILYTSTTGSTEQYCKWLKQEFPKSGLYNLEEYDFANISKYDLLIIGSPVRGGKFEAVEFIKPHIEQLERKKILMMAVGAVPEEEKWSIRSYRRIPKEIRNLFDEYMKLPGISKKPKGLERFMMKFILGVNIENIAAQDNVKREDLDRVIKWIKKKIS